MDFYAHILGMKQWSVAIDPAYSLMGLCKSSKTGQILGRIRFLSQKNERKYRRKYSSLPIRNCSVP